MFFQSQSQGLYANVKLAHDSLYDEIAVAPTTAFQEASRFERAVPLEELAALHRSAFGGDPEVLICDFKYLTCGVNTHIGSHVGRVGEEPMQNLGYRAGIMVGIETGIVHQWDTSDPTIIGPSPQPVFLKNG